MAESSTAVALIFDDVELGGQLREALREHGARIVHEGALSTLSRSMLNDTGAQVLVVNLDEEAEDELDRLYDVIDGDHPRVVFNDAQASRQLGGWDRARWARHLAVKVMAQGDLDPPRPQDAPAVPETVVNEFAPAEAEEPEAIAEFVPDFEPVDDFVETPAEPVAEIEGGEVSEVSETLAAELEALLAADEPQAMEDDFGSLKFVAEDELPPLHDGHFGVDTLATQGPAPVEPEPPMLPPRAMPSFQLDHLSLSPLDDSFLPSTTSESVEKGPSSLLGLASSWSLVDETEASAIVAPVETADYGIEKLSAAEFLAPEGGNEDESFLKPGMTLELVSIEEAIAPKAYEGGHEMVLTDLDAAISRVLVIGAASDSTDAVCSFLSRLPIDLRATVVHVQHMGSQSAEMLVDQMADHCDLPVNIAAHGGRARMGEVLVVPAGHQARVQRDGRVELQPLDGQDGRGSSPIDASFTMAANVFGRNALAIVFAGQANDALGGSQAIYDRGGQVWVEASGESHFPDMVHGIEAERLNSYSGTPAELAARLVEEMSMEGRR
ncbi:chemotaxis protein CheB [Dyella amyloliquefaciens]|uniref:chemotaxis protein CheB n=1 Tax=Dyella amyloliquefaciens TaxID=1770545 RepID=UPI00102E4522|nr:chemotaxis protein CheB [Dyella amyloliquefaciens]